MLENQCDHVYTTEKIILNTMLKSLEYVEDSTEKLMNHNMETLETRNYNDELEESGSFLDKLNILHSNSKSLLTCSNRLLERIKNRYKR